MRELIREIFYDIHSAEEAYQQAIKIGYRSEEINLIMSEETRKQYHGSGSVASLENHIAAKQILKGSVTGAAIGAAFGILTAIGINFALPGLGFIVAGSVFGGLASAGAGALAGGLAEFLNPLGIAEEEARQYEKDIKNGGILIAVVNEADSVASQTLQKKWHSLKEQECAM